MDAGVMLKPLLSRGELRCIGATTTDKYRRFIEKDPALERRFQQVGVGGFREGPGSGQVVPCIDGNVYDSAGWARPVFRV